MQFSIAIYIATRYIIFVLIVKLLFVLIISVISYCCYDIGRVMDTEHQNAFETLLAGDVLQQLAQFFVRFLVAFQKHNQNDFYVYSCHL